LLLTHVTKIQLIRDVVNSRNLANYFVSCASMLWIVSLCSLCKAVILCYKLANT